jgi:NADPH2:quinone reductase
MAFRALIPDEITVAVDLNYPAPSPLSESFRRCPLHPSAEVLSMKAVLLRHFGDPGELRVEEVAQPEPRNGEALIKILAAGIQPSDVKNVQGGMAGTTLPRIPGRDFAGIVVGGPEHLMGRTVWGTGGDIGFTRDGSHAEFMAVPADALLEKPEKLNAESAGAAGLTFVTAWLALVSFGAVAANDTVLILGAAGGVGSAALQIAKLFGATVLAGVRNREQAGQISGYSPAAILETGSEDFLEQVHSRSSSRGVDLVFDTTGYLFAEAIEAAAHGGRVCVISAPPEGTAQFNLRSLYRKELRVIGADSRRLDVTACAKLLARMNPEFQSGRLRAPAPAVYPLNQAGAAYRKRMEGNGLCCLKP